MKSIFTALIFLLAFAANAQDVIVTKDGFKKDVKVVEITETNIRYKNYDHQDGPIRNILISKVDKIIYENGKEEVFRSSSHSTPTPPPPPPVVKENPKPTPPPVRKERRRKKEFKGFGTNGFYAEGVIGSYLFTRDASYWGGIPPGSSVPEPIVQSTSYFGQALGFQMGNKWFFGNSEKRFRAGLQVSWMRFQVGFDLDNEELNFLISPLQLGFTGITKLSDRWALETNLNAGMTAMLWNPDFDALPYPPIVTSASDAYGLSVNPAIKFRYKSLAFGVDYNYIHQVIDSPTIGNRNARIQSFNFTIGRKF